MTNTETLPAAIQDIIESNVNPQFAPLLLASPAMLHALKLARAWFNEYALDYDGIDPESETGILREAIEKALEEAEA